MTDFSLVKVDAEDLSFFQKLLGPVIEAGSALTDKIRMYRWESSIKTLQKAKDIAEKNNIPMNEIPLKFLIPFMEKSSLEDKDDNEITEMWANLLVSSADDEEIANPIYVEILSGLVRSDVQVLNDFLPENFFKEFCERVFRTEEEGSLMTPPTRLALINTTNAEVLYRDLRSAVDDIVNVTCSEEERYDFASKKLSTLSQESRGASNYLTINLQCEKMRSDGGADWFFAPNIDLFTSIDAVERLIYKGLIEKTKDQFNIDGVVLDYSIVAPTYLSVQFLRACRGNRFAESTSL